MDGVYSTNVAMIIEKPFDYDCWGSLGYDVTGDGIIELIIWRGSDYQPPFHYGFRIVDPVNGQIVWEFYDPGYDFYQSYPGSNNDYFHDIDNDGWNELIVQRYNHASYEYQHFVYQTNGPASVSGGGNNIASSFSLSQNYPNPFNPATNITYELAKPEPVEIQIFDPAGRLIRAFNPGAQTPGPHKWVWDGKNDGGATVASGVYFYTLRAGGRTEAKKMIMLR